MPKVKKHLIDRLNEAGIFRGYAIQRKPGHMYYEKQSDGTYKRLNAGSVKDAFDYKRWKWEDVIVPRKPKAEPVVPAAVV